MKLLSSILFCSLSIFLMVSCGQKEDPPPASDCDGLLDSGGEMEVDGETLSLTIAQLLISSGFDGDIYQFQVGAMAGNCNDVSVLSFIVEIPSDTDLDGAYQIKDFFDASLNDAYGVTITSQTLDPVSQSSVSIDSGTIDIIKHSANDYSVDLNGDLVGGGNTSISFRKAF